MPKSQTSTSSPLPCRGLSHPLDSAGCISQSEEICGKEGSLDNMLIHGDNKAAMKNLLEQGYGGKIQMIYIDPPFFSKADYDAVVKAGDKQIRHLAYEDKWSKGMSQYLLSHPLDSAGCISKSTNLNPSFVIITSTSISSICGMNRHIFSITSFNFSQFGITPFSSLPVTTSCITSTILLFSSRHLPPQKDLSHPLDSAGCISNAGKIGAKSDDYFKVENRYTGREIKVTNSTIKHGLEGDYKRLLTNGRIGAVVGEAIRHAVPINGLHDTASNANGTYAMAGLATEERSNREFVYIVTIEQYNDNVSEIEVYDVGHSVNGRIKKSNLADTKSPGLIPTEVATVSIADFLKIVNEPFTPAGFGGLYFHFRKI